MSSDGIGVIGEDRTGSTDMDRVHPAVHTARAVQWGEVSPAHWLRPPPQLDVATVVRSLGQNVAPASSPGVLDQPEVPVSGVGPVTHQEDGVVDDNVRVVVTTVEHSAVVQAPVRGRHRGGQRSWETVEVER